MLKKIFSLGNLCQLLLLSASALLLSACFPGMGDMGGLVFIALIPFLTAIYRVKGKGKFIKGFFYGYLGGLLFWLINLKWLIKMADLDFVPLAGAMLGWIALPGYLAIYFAIFGAIVAKWANPFKVSTKGTPSETPNKSTKQRSSVEEKIATKLSKQKKAKIANKYLLSIKLSYRSILFATFHASLWTILEWMRSWVFTGFSWNGLGTAFHDIPVFAQGAELVGVISLSFVPMFVTSILLQVAMRFFTEAKKGKLMPHFDLMVAGLLIAALFGFGISRLFALAGEEKREVSFLLIQQNLSLNTSHGEEHIENIFNYLSMTEEGLEEVEDLNKAIVTQSYQSEEETIHALEAVDFVVWPESALIYGINYAKESGTHMYAPVESDAVGRAINLGPHHLITGANEYHFKSKEAVINSLPEESYNSIAFFKKTPNESSLITTYKKNHLVIFGEYIPFRNTFSFLEKIVGSAQGGGAMGPNFSSGNSTDPVAIELHRKELQLIASVCFEDTVANLARKSVRSADQVIINVTNDGWFSNSEQPMQHFANARFRCIELRRPMVRSANTGLSCIINSRGSIKKPDGSLKAIYTEEHTTFQKGKLFAKAEILKSNPITLYALAGDWFIFVCLLLLLLSSVLKSKMVKLD